VFRDRNVIATQPGNDPESDAVYILCAHYDTWWNTTGANDDGSGIAALLTIARICAPHQFNTTLKFIAFSGHEVGLLGSYASAKNAYFNNENIAGVIMLDMIGNTSASGNIIQLHTSPRAEWLARHIQQVKTTYADYLPIVVEEITNTAVDEKSYLAFGYDGLMFHQPNSGDLPNHCPGDTLDTINFPFLTNVTKLVLPVVVTLIDTPLEVQVQFINPKEEHLHHNDNTSIPFPPLNHRNLDKRGLTHIIGEITFCITITSTEEIKAVYYAVDNEILFNNITTEPPYTWKLSRPKKLKNLKNRLGYHNIGVTVTTISGHTAYDEMDVFVWKL
jgi:hypothetical protein